MPRLDDADGHCRDRVAAARLPLVAFGLPLDDRAPRGTPSRAVAFELHRSFGIVPRVAWRTRRPAVPVQPLGRNAS